MTASNDRGVSDVVGYVLLIGVVTAGIAAVLLIGGSAVEEIKTDTRAETADVSFSEADQRLTALSGTRVNSTRFQFRSGEPGRVKVRSNTGHVNISVNHGKCQVQVPLSALVYERADGGTLALQAGGEFARTPDGASTVVSPPSFAASNGTIDLTTYNLSGFVDDDTVEIRKNSSASINRTQAIAEELRNGHPSCARPDVVRISVQSTYYEAWAEHLERETGVAATTYASNQTAEVTLPQTWLPRRADDSRNKVLNLSDANNATITHDGDAAPASAPSINGNDCSGLPNCNDSISIGKGAGNTYTVVALPIGNGTQSSYVRRVEGDKVLRQPIDVVFVMDESGSMSNDGPNGNVKLESAKRAAKNFTGQINSSTDRVAFVGFSEQAYYHRVETSNRFFTSNKTRANQTIDTYQTRSGTGSVFGLDAGNTIHDLRERSGSRKVMIQLSDGQNNECRTGSCSEDEANKQALREAKRAAKNNVTIFTVGFGDQSNINETHLMNVAQVTGGKYNYAANRSALDSVFQEILANITSVRAIVHRPTTAEMTIGGSTVQPSLGYSNPNVNQINGTYDINDPAFRGGFEFAATASAGNLINATTVSYECEPGAFQLTDQFVLNETTNETYRRVRCTDVNESSKTVVSPSNTEIFLDDAPTSELPNDDEAWYQSDLVNDTLDDYISGGTLQLDSNQAVVVYEYTVGGTESRLVMLYEIGLPQGRTSVDIFDLRVVNATIGDA